MAEGLVGGSLVRRLHDNCLPAGVAPAQQQDHLPCLHYLPHDGICNTIPGSDSYEDVGTQAEDDHSDNTISLFALLGLDLPQVELQLLALQHVAVGPAALAGPGGDGGQDTAGHELVGEALLDLGVLLSLGVLLGGLLGPLLVEVGLLGVGQLGALLATQGQGEVGLVPENNRNLQ